MPAAALSALSYTAILYPSVGLTPGAGPFLFFALTTFVNLMIATLIGCAAHACDAFQSMLTHRQRSFTFASVMPGEIAPAVMLPCYATLNTLVAGFLITRNTIPSACALQCLRIHATRLTRLFLAVIWRWLYTISYEQWLWSSLMINQFDGQAYSEYCNGAGSTLEAVAGLLPGPALAPPAQLATMAGACVHLLHAPLYACS